MYVNGVGAENSLFCAYFFCIYLKGFWLLNVRTLNWHGYVLFYMNCFALFSKSERGFFYLFSLLVGIAGECSFVERG